MADSDAAVAERIRARQQAFAQAVVLLASNQPDAAEDLLGSVCAAKPGTGQWHVYVAGGLVRAAYSLREDGADQPKSIKVAARALRQLEIAEQKQASEPEALANVWELRASIYEGLWGDSQLALESYRQAAARNPASASLTAKIRRLERHLASSEG